MKNVIDVCMNSGCIQMKYDGIYEIYPRKAHNTIVLEAALQTLAKTHDITQIFNDYYRAFPKKKKRYIQNIENGNIFEMSEKAELLREAKELYDIDFEDNTNGVDITEYYQIIEI